MNITAEELLVRIKASKATTLSDQWETRCVKGLEVRDADTAKFPGSIGTVVGYAAKFNSPSRDFGGFRENITKGAFTRSLQQTDDLHDVRALLGHDKTRVLGRRSAGTLEIREDDIGLPVAIHLIDTTDGQDTLKNVRAGNLDAMSFGFPKAKATWRGQGTSNMIRDLSDIDLREVSVVSWAMYEQTELSVRDLATFASELPPVVTSAPVSVLKLQREALELRYNHEHGKGGLFATSAEADALSAKAKAASAKADASGKTSDHAVAQVAHVQAARAHASARDRIEYGKGANKQSMKHGDTALSHRIAADTHLFKAFSD